MVKMANIFAVRLRPPLLSSASFRRLPFVEKFTLHSRRTFYLLNHLLELLLTAQAAPSTQHAHDRPSLASWAPCTPAPPCTIIHHPSPTTDQTDPITSFIIHHNAPIIQWTEIKDNRKSPVLRCKITSEEESRHPDVQSCNSNRFKSKQQRRLRSNLYPGSRFTCLCTKVEAYATTC